MGDGSEIVMVSNTGSGVRVGDEDQVLNSIPSGALQDPGGIVGEQGATRRKGNAACQPVPKIRFFLGQADVIGTNDAMETMADGNFVQFDLQGLRVGGGHQEYLFAVLFEKIKKIKCMGAKSDEVSDAELELDDIELELFRPEIEVGPVQGLFHRSVTLQ